MYLKNYQKRIYLHYYYGIELFKKRDRVAYIFNGNYTYITCLDRLAEPGKVRKRQLQWSLRKIPKT